jgi:uncharacterized protein YkwD
VAAVAAPLGLAVAGEDYLHKADATPDGGAVSPRGPQGKNRLSRVGTMGARIAATILACGTALAVPAGVGADGTQLPQRMLAAVNEVRAQHGLPPYRGSDTLHRSARRYARWMIRADYFGHVDRIRASSRYSQLGENLAWHSGSRPRVGHTVRAWMRSPTHRALILHPGFRWLGAGAARGRIGGSRGVVWVLHFGGALSASGASAPPVPLLGAQLPGDASIRSADSEIVPTISPAGAAAASAAP